MSTTFVVDPLSFGENIINTEIGVKFVMKSKSILQISLMDFTLQQFKVLKENTDLMVDFYHGTKVRVGKSIDGKKVDEWDASIWDHETSKNQVSFIIYERL